MATRPDDMECRRVGGVDSGGWWERGWREDAEEGGEGGGSPAAD